MITEDYISFEVAKLLKEKGFNELCFRLIREDGDIVEAPSQTWNGMTKKQKAQFYLCPTHQKAMKWLREMFHIHIRLIHSSDESYKFEIYPMAGEYRTKCFESYTYYSSYEEAVEAALKYVLENLI